MAKLVLSLDEMTLREMPLPGSRTVIGRRASCDVRIENLAVSGEHACIIHIAGESFVEDMGSTNGTFVNGQAVTRHRLQHDDVIGIGRYQLRYVAHSVPAAADAEITQTILIQPPAAPQPASVPVAAAFATLRILSGPGAGRELDLTRSPVTLGRPGMQVAAITRQGRDYVITHGGSDAPPRVNDRPVAGGRQSLCNHDQIELAGVRVEFFFRP